MSLFPNTGNNRTRAQAREEDQREVLRLRTCLVCPLKDRKLPDDFPAAVDILIISDTIPVKIDSSVTGYQTYHAFTVECLPIGSDAKNTERQCCLGRKRDLIEKLKPKIVIAVGGAVFSEIEDITDNGPSIGFAEDFRMFPTRYKEDSFWLVKIPPILPELKINLIKLQSLINEHIQKPCHVEWPNISGITYVTRTADIKHAFDYLKRQEIVGQDIETSADKSIYSFGRPYSPGAKILTLAMSDGIETYGFPLYHPQTPRSFDIDQVFAQYIDLRKSNARVISHNQPFEWEWLSYFLGTKIPYLGKTGCTMLQAYLINHRSPRSYGYLTRKWLGWNIKHISGIDVMNLINEPLEDVLRYNCYDTKYLPYIWRQQESLMDSMGISQNLRDMQNERGIAAPIMQMRGLVPNPEFITDQTNIWKAELNHHLALFRELDECKRFEQTFGYSPNPNSDHPTSGDVPKLFKSFCGVPKDRTKFDDPFLSKRKNCKVSQELLAVRKRSKIYGTYLAGLNPHDDHENAGKHIYPDGLIHTQLNTMKVITGRLSSEEPNGQNFTKRHGLEYLRNVIKAPEHHYILSGDLGQIEYRMIAILSGDQVMIDAINNDLDIHMWWAERCMVLFPNKFVNENNENPCTFNPETMTPCDPICFKCEKKEFRNQCKNGLVFPFCYGARNEKLQQTMNITDLRMCDAIGEEFWAKHKRVKEWHGELAYQLGRQGYIENFFGRRYYAPLTSNQIANYPVQGSAGDLHINSMSRMTRYGVEVDEPQLIPILQVHDDLLFYIHEDRLQELAGVIIPKLLDLSSLPTEIPVPLTLGLSLGRQWGSMEEIGTFSSDEVN